MFIPPGGLRIAGGASLLSIALALLGRARAADRDASTARIRKEYYGRRLRELILLKRQRTTAGHNATWERVGHSCLTQSSSSPCQHRLGALIWRDGFEMRSSTSTLVGGFSDLSVADDSHGQQLLAVSDGGWLVSFARPAPAADASITTGAIVLHAVPDQAGGSLGNWWAGNPEALLVGSSFGLLALEGKRPRVLRYLPVLARSQPTTHAQLFASPRAPPVIVRGVSSVVAPHCTGANFGIESMTLLEDMGRPHLLIICESPSKPRGSYADGWSANDTHTPAFLFTLTNAIAHAPPYARLVGSFRLPLSDGLMPSAMARLPPWGDRPRRGDTESSHGNERRGLLVLERVYLGERGCVIRIKYLHEAPFREAAARAASGHSRAAANQPPAAADQQPARLLSPVLVAEMCPDESLTDNFEGLALEPSKGGGVRVLLVTDNNFASREWAAPRPQRTLLYEFELDRQVLEDLVEGRRAPSRAPRCAALDIVDRRR